MVQNIMLFCCTTYHCLKAGAHFRNFSTDRKIIFLRHEIIFWGLEKREEEREKCDFVWKDLLTYSCSRTLIHGVIIALLFFIIIWLHLNWCWWQLQSMLLLLLLLLLIWLIWLRAISACIKINFPSLNTYHVEWLLLDILIFQWLLTAFVVF